MTCEGETVVDVAAVVEVETFVVVGLA